MAKDTRKMDLTLGRPIAPKNNPTLGRAIGGTATDTMEPPDDESSDNLNPPALTPPAGAASDSNMDPTKVDTMVGGPAAPPIEPTLGQNNPAPTAGDRLKELTAQGAPEYHGFKRFADTLAGTTRIGQAVEEAGHFGTFGYKGDVAQAGEGAKLENEQLNAEAGRQKTQAETGHIQAQTAGEQAGDEIDPKTGLLRKNMAAYDAAQLRAPVQNANAIANLRRAGLKLDDQGNFVPLTDADMTPRDKAQRDLDNARAQAARAQAEYAKFRSDPNNPIYKTAQAHAQAAAENAQRMNKAFQFQYEPWLLTPEEQQSSTLPHSPNGAPIALKSPEAPTGSTRNSAQAAGTVSDQVPRILQEIDSNASKLGPFQGRFEQAYVTRFGANDPQYAQMDQDLMMLSTGSAKAHLGVRGAGAVSGAAQEWRNSLREAQSAEDLKARIQSVDHWMQGYAASGGGGQSPQAPHGGTAPKERAVIKLVP